jgi:hypothetical protein
MVAPTCLGITLPSTDRHAPRHWTHHAHPQYPSIAPQLSISQKTLGTRPEDGNVMPKHVGATIHN